MSSGPAPHEGHASATEAGRNDAVVLDELRSLRGMMEKRLASMNWHEGMKRHPVAATLLCQLLSSGFSTALARAASSALPTDCDEAAALPWLRTQLANKLNCLNGEEELISAGGVFAFTGPTGVGKTTTVAKIAARCVVRHGAESLGLITTDSYRIGAQDQLRVFGRILGVPVYTVQDATSLADTLKQIGHKRLILIDTIGLGQRDQRVLEQIELLKGCNVRRVVVLAATAQLETLEDVIQTYGSTAQGDSIAGVILSKIDEAVKLGSALDVVLRYRLPVLFCTNGQRVPEDIAVPNRDDLLEFALSPPSTDSDHNHDEDVSLFASWSMSENIGGGVAYA